MAASISASSNTSTGALPPSSMCMRFTLSAVAPMMCAPVGMEPVSDTMRTLGWVTSGLPTVWPRPNRILSTPGGSRSCASSPRRRAVSGVSSEGLITTVLPAAKAGATFQANIING
ncbi:hypothetical protein D3C79_726950 [compost metagenome]